MNSKIKNILRPFYHSVRRIAPYCSIFYRYYKQQQLNLIQQQFAKKLLFFNSKIKHGNGILLVQIVENYEYALKFAAISKAISQKENLEVNFYNVLIDWINGAKEKKTLPEKIIKNKNTKLFSSFGNRVLFDNSDLYSDQVFIKEKLTNIVSTLDLDNPTEILSIKFENILVGDLIYDTYLRFFHQPTIEEINKDVIHIIEVALNVFYNFTLFIKKNNVKVLLNSYSSYVHHGIPARICLHNNIKVYSIGSYSYIIQQLSIEFPYHQIDHTLFSPDKNLNADKIALAQQKLTSRFEGKIDDATSYMRQSAFSASKINPELKKTFTEKTRNIIIYTHDFYDSPHIDRMLQFADLYQFLKQTLAAVLNLEKTNVFIKLHPNGIKGCKEKAIELVENFNAAHFHVLDETASNLHIIELKPDLIVTARGTVGIEMAYFGIPTVALYDNLYCNFNFVHTCKSIAEYFAILRGEAKPIIDFTKEKIFSFYYQAYLEKIDRKNIDALTVLHSYKDHTFTDKYLEFILSNKENIFNNNFTNLYLNELN